MPSRKEGELLTLAEKRIHMEETAFVTGIKDSSFFLSFPAVFILCGSLEEGEEPGGESSPPDSDFKPSHDRCPSRRASIGKCCAILAWVI
jgi:hypothetical protein